MVKKKHSKIKAFYEFLLLIGTLALCAFVFYVAVRFLWVWTRYLFA